MIDSLKRPEGSLRWPPRQRFVLSAAGEEAKAAWDRAVAGARCADGGRAGLEAAERSWAEPLLIDPGDGIFLSEISRNGRTVAHIAEALADCGTTKAEAQAAIDRLFKAGLILPEPKPAG